MLNILKGLSERFQNKGYKILEAYLHAVGAESISTRGNFLDFLQFNGLNGLVAFVLFNKNNGKLIPPPLWGKIRKHNFVKSPSKEFLPSPLICSGLLKIWESISIRKHLTQKDKSPEVWSLDEWSALISL